MNRALRAATVGVLLLCPVALSACSAGQVTQTATQNRDKVGAMAEIGPLTLRAVEFAYPRGSIYEAGDDAELTLAIANSGREDDALVEVTGEGFGDVEFDTGGEASGSGSRIEIPAGETVYVDGDDLGITLTDLDDSLTTGQALELTFGFDNAGEVPLRVPVSTPDEAREREEGFDFHHEEGGGAGSEEEQEGEQREGGE